MSKYKKQIILFLLVIELCSVYLTFSSFSNKNVTELKEKTEVNKEMFSMYIENDDEEYVEYSDSEFFPAGYVLNKEKSYCLDNEGKNIPGLLSSVGNSVTLTSNKNVYCYLYFNIEPISIYNRLLKDYETNNKVKLVADTSSNDYPVYYYYDSATNNNILYGGFCWKMVLSTETGGVKVIYNGVPTNGTCSNSGSGTTIGSTSWQSDSDSYSLAYAGYMYNTVYETIQKDMRGYTALYYETFSSSIAAHYYGDTFTYDGSRYILANSDGSEVIIENYSDSSRYTCRSYNSKSCSTLYYYVGAYANTAYFISLTDGKDIEDYKIKFATSVLDNGNGTYTLVNPIEMLRSDYFDNYSLYSGYYYCSDLTSETCNDMFYSYSLNHGSIRGFSNYKYGNYFTYNNGTYTLTDTIDFWDWSTNYSTLGNNHYTCFNSTGQCSELYYIYDAYSNSSSQYANSILLTEGESVEDALHKMLYADNVNEIDSAMKKKIDAWYVNNLLDVKDKNGVLYSKYLENAIFCANREITRLGGWDPNGGDLTSGLLFNASSLNCANKTDQFTLKTESGGTKGYGNNALDYPIGLLSSGEIVLVGATGSGYLKNNVDYWTMTANDMNYRNGIYKLVIRGGNVSASGYIGLSNTAVYKHNSKYLRPVVSLDKSVMLVSGKGTTEKPYKTELIE